MGLGVLSSWCVIKVARLLGLSAGPDNHIAGHAGVGVVSPN